MLGRLALEGLWSGIAALGAQTLFLGLRTGLGPGFAWFGGSLLALAALFAWPVWFPGSLPSPVAAAAPYGLAAAGIYCATGVARLIGRFLALHGANRETMEHLAAAFGSLRESASLAALGASAATLSHEIRNYAATLRGNALLLRRDVDADGYREGLEGIRSTAEKLEAVSRDIAVYSDSGVPSAKTLLRLDDLVRGCVAAAFPERARAIRIGPWPGGLEVRGDAGKLERVFLNLFRNAFEAGAGTLEVRFRACGGRVVAAVEDDGGGCDPAELERLAIPFWSGRRGGTGLGCAIASSTLAGHGASFRAYARNALPRGGTGLLLNLVFPAEGAAPAAPLSMPVAAEDPGVRADLIAPLVNLGIRPAYVAWDGAAALGTGGGLPLLAEPSVVPRLGRGWPDGILCVDAARTARWIGDSARDPLPFLFTEEFLAALAEGAPR